MLNQTQCREFCQLRQQIIQLDYIHLNPPQRQAVMAAQGPLLLLAGAGSGKTTVLIHRIACLLRYGRGADSDWVPDYADEEDLSFLREYAARPDADPRAVARKNLLCAVEPALPWSVLAITFTNKAAGELKQRLERLLGAEAEGVWASTFHSACLRILRRDCERLGLESSFTIYDTDDAQRVIKDILKDFRLDEKLFPPKSVLGYISRAKDRLLMGPEYLEECRRDADVRLIQIAKIYVEYQRRLWEASALDFDDIIFHTVRLLQQEPELCRFYQNKFRYVLIDEYQDTNNLQYQLASLLAGGWRNICVVGDDDQSIYRFRGATIENILSFTRQYSDARTIRLEQNYRSTGNILDAANAVIGNNRRRTEKTLWTEQAAGEPVELYSAQNEQDEARYVAMCILKAVGKGTDWRDHAILYRMNAQSRELEYAFKQNGIPYRIFGGTRYFDRAEVKDMLAYLCVLHNPGDDLRLRRIINVPARGIGQRSLELAQQLATRQGLSLYQVIAHARDYPELERSRGRLLAFVTMLEGLRQQVDSIPLPELYQQLLSATGYLSALEAKNSIENRSRAENVRELASSIQGYLDNAQGEASLAGFLDEIALYTDLDSYAENDNMVVMMTMHAAKGLEFPHVYVVGVEEGIFPSHRILGEPEELEEERRLCYVAMTRARERLVLSCTAQRMLFGRTESNPPSRFVKEIPEALLNKTGQGHRELRSSLAYGRGKPYGVNPSGHRSGNAFGGSRPVQKPSAPLPQLRKGELVEHSSFGRGIVLSLRPMGGDALLEIAFDAVGTKKLMLKAAARYLTKPE